MSAIALAGIEKSFGDTRVLKGVDLSIDAGEFITLVGPSGCGKSTLLRLMAGLDAPCAGDIRIAGRSVNTVRAADRNLAMVFQSYALYPHLTIAENMMTPLRLRDLSFHQRLPLIGPLMARARHKVMRGKVDETARLLKIEALLERKPGQLSGGQRQRAALGRAMVRQPVAFLMDEPLSNLDAALRVHMRAELAELHRQLKATFIYVTHDQAEALTMSDRMAVMMGGSILQLGRPEEVYNNPVDIRVAEFVGSPKINLLAGEIDAQGRVTVRGHRLERQASAGAAGPVTVGLRPEHLSLTGNASEACLSGRVIHRENLGADIFVHMVMSDATTRVIVRATPFDASHLSIGDDVHVALVRGQAMIFGADGRRLPLAVEAAPAIQDVA